MLQHSLIDSTLRVATRVATGVSTSLLLIQINLFFHHLCGNLTQFHLVEILPSRHVYPSLYLPSSFARGSATSSLLSASVARRKRRRSEGEAKDERETNGERTEIDREPIRGEDVVFSKVCCCKDSYHTSFLNWMKPIIIRYLYIFKN